jgi:hypothetical protein
MNQLLQEIAGYLDGLGLVVYDPDGMGDEPGTAFIERMPDEPVAAVALFSARSSQRSDVRNDMAYPSVRIDVRAGGDDPRTAAALAESIHEALHMQHQTQFVADGLWIYLCAATLPARGRTDETGAYTYSFTADLITARE